MITGSGSCKLTSIMNRNDRSLLRRPRALAFVCFDLKVMLVPVGQGEERGKVCGASLISDRNGSGQSEKYKEGTRKVEKLENKPGLDRL